MKRESKEPKRGRPVMPKGEALDAIIPVTRCKASERKAYDAAAKKKGLTLSEFVRQTLNEAVKQ